MMNLVKTNEPWLDVVSGDLKKTRLKNVAEVNARALSATTDDEYALRYLEISNVNNRGIISESAIEELSFIDAPSRAKRIVRSGDTVISSVRPNLQAVAYIDQASDNFIASTGFYVVSPNQNKLHPKYMYYLLLSEDTKQYLEAVAKGVGYPAVDDKDFVTTKLLLPSVPEQRRIATYLDKTCVAIDTAIEKKQKQLETLDALRKTIIHKAVTRGLDDSVELKDSGHEWLGPIPAMWKLIAIKRIVSTKITDGPHETPELSDEGIQFISAEAIKNNQIDFDLRRGFIALELHQQYCRKCKPQKKDIFIIKSGATTGNVAYVDVDFEFSIWSPLAVVRCDDHIAFYKFIYYVFLSDVFRKQVELSWSFGTQQNIGMRVIERIKVPIPPVEEQKKIATFLDNETFRISEIRVNIESQITTLTAYRKSLIHECVTGKRRIIETDVAQIKANDNAEK